jgi:hypothetical protein
MFCAAICDSVRAVPVVTFFSWAGYPIGSVQQKESAHRQEVEWVLALCGQGGLVRSAELRIPLPAHEIASP